MTSDTTREFTADQAKAEIMRLHGLGQGPSAIAKVVGRTRSTVRTIINTNKQWAPAYQDGIPLELIDPNPWQPRAALDQDGIEELAADIAQNGVLQKPLLRPTGEGDRYQTAFGHYRIAAVAHLGWTAIEVEVRDLNNNQMAIYALSENRKRRALKPIDEFRAYQKVLDEIEGQSLGSLAEQLGMDHSTLSNNLRLLELPEFVLALIDSGEMFPTSAREFLVLQNSDHQHLDLMQAVIEDIQDPDNERRGAPDWRRANVRQTIYETIAVADFSPLEGPSATGGYYRGSPFSVETAADVEPIFDTAKFIKKYPDHLHVVPSPTVDDNRIATWDATRPWTCKQKEWEKLQTPLLEAQKRAERSNGQQTVAQDEREEHALALANDPLYRATAPAGEGQEDVLAEARSAAKVAAADTLSEQLGEERPATVEEFLREGPDHGNLEPPEDDTEAIPAELTEPAVDENVEDPGAAVEEAIKTTEADATTKMQELIDQGLTDTELIKAIRDVAAEIPDSRLRAVFQYVAGEFIDHYRAALRTATAQAIDPQALTDEQKEALGTRAAPVQQLGYHGYKHDEWYRRLEMSDGESTRYDSARHADGKGGNLPPWFPDIAECLETCAIGAAYAQLGGQEPVKLFCFNQAHFAEKEERGRLAALALWEESELNVDQAMCALVLGLSDHLTLRPNVLRLLAYTMVAPLIGRYTRSGFEKYSAYSDLDTPEFFRRDHWVALRMREILQVSEPEEEYDRRDFTFTGKAAWQGIAGIPSADLVEFVACLIIFQVQSNPAFDGIPTLVDAAALGDNEQLTP